MDINSVSFDTKKHNSIFKNNSNEVTNTTAYIVK